jgi:hypothetical protein
MPRIDKQTLIASICPPLDPQLTNQLLDEFVSQERRYVLRDWEPATLDGGQFAEAAARILYHQDSTNLNRTRSVDQCLTYVEDPTNNNTHHYPNRKSALHTARVIRTIYKFRSDRGAVHIDPNYTANHLDSKLVIENSQWVLSEILRVFWTGGPSDVAAAVRAIIEYDVPVIGNYEGRLLVERVDCTVEEEILILLHHAGENGLSRAQLGQYVQKPSPRISESLTRLSSPQMRQILKLQNGNYRLTNLGIQRVLQDLATKLLI